MEITVEELLKKGNVNIIDIRNTHKYVEGHIPGAISIDSYQLLFYTDQYLKKDETYYIYCDSGVRSRMIAKELSAKGYSVISVIGGYQNYLLRK